METVQSAEVVKYVLTSYNSMVWTTRYLQSLNFQRTIPFENHLVHNR